MFRNAHAANLRFESAPRQPSSNENRNRALGPELSRREPELRGREDAISELPSLSDTGRGRWVKFGLLSAAGYSYGEIAERTGTATGDVGAELKALKRELS